ncbi:hypothetical protein SprV_0100070400 [Sparganum proliferum]
MQSSMDLFAACDDFGLIINMEKTVVLHQQPTDSACVAPQISMNGARLQAVDNFTYPGSTLSRNTKIYDEVTRRISTAIQVFGRLQNTAWNRRGPHLDTKFKVYKTDILRTLLYGKETLTMQAQRPDHFHLICLRQILKLSWQDRITERTGILSIHAMLR